VKDEHVNDAAQDVAQEVAQELDVLGAAKDESGKVFIVARAIFHRCTRRSSGGTHDVAQEAAQDSAEDEAWDMAQTWPLGARAARALPATPPPPPPPSLCSWQEARGAKMGIATGQLSSVWLILW